MEGSVLDLSAQGVGGEHACLRSAHSALVQVVGVVCTHPMGHGAWD
jgi:hypothetical protein